MKLNKPATAREKIRVHLTVFIPADGITCFDGTLLNRESVHFLDCITWKVLTFRVLQPGKLTISGLGNMASDPFRGF